MGSRIEDSDRAAYFGHSFKAVDGLWFMMVEEKHGFEEALRIDEAVWQVVPKIQARMLQGMRNQHKGLAALCECLTTHLDWGGHVFDCTLDEQAQRLEIRIEQCPWLQLLNKSNRKHLAERIGPRICTAEYGTWGAEFGENIRFRLGETMCQGGTGCLLQYELCAGDKDSAEAS